MTSYRVLIVDDEAAVLAALRRSLRHHYGRALEVETQVDAEAALERATEQDFDLVISDLRMPAMDGVTFLRRFAAIRPRSVRMMLTGSVDFESMQRAINDAGVFRYLCKPWDDRELSRHIDAALARAAAVNEEGTQALAWRNQLDAPSPQEIERRRLEQDDPGITQVEWGPNGEVLMPPLNFDRE